MQVLNTKRYTSNPSDCTAAPLARPGPLTGTGVIRSVSGTRLAARSARAEVSRRPRAAIPSPPPLAPLTPAPPAPQRIIARADRYGSNQSGQKAHKGRWKGMDSDMDLSDDQVRHAQRDPRQALRRAPFHPRARVARTMKDASRARKWARMRARLQPREPSPEASLPARTLRAAPRGLGPHSASAPGAPRAACIGRSLARRPGPAAPACGRGR
jgi:hypothetical protein